MNEDTAFYAKCALGVVCFLGVCLVGYLVISGLHSFYSSAQAMLNTASSV
jgi:hypothetical protein